MDYPQGVRARWPHLWGSRQVGFHQAVHGVHGVCLHDQATPTAAAAATRSSSQQKQHTVFDGSPGLVQQASGTTSKCWGLPVVRGALTHLVTLPDGLQEEALSRIRQGQPRLACRAEQAMQTLQITLNRGWRSHAHQAVSPPRPSSRPTTAVSALQHQNVPA